MKGFEKKFTPVPNHLNPTPAPTPSEVEWSTPNHRAFENTVLGFLIITVSMFNLQYLFVDL